jgi:Transcriptional regulator
MLNKHATMHLAHSEGDIQMIDSYLWEELAVFSRTGTLTKTAEELNVTQPSVTRSMQKLEDDIGVKLFDRKANRIKLTPTGEMAAKEAEKLIEASETSVNRIKNFDRSQHFTILGSTSPGPIIMLNELKKNIGQQVQITGDIIPDKLVESFLINNEADIILSDQEILSDKVESQYIGEERLQVNLDKFTFLANQKTVTFEQLKDMSFIVMNNIGLWKNIIQNYIPDAQFMYQEDRNSFTEITKHSSFPFFTTNLSQTNPFFKESLDENDDRIAIPISDESARVINYATYLTSQKSRLSPMIDKIRQQWPNNMAK